MKKKRVNVATFSRENHCYSSYSWGFTNGAPYYVTPSPAAAVLS